MKRNSFKRKWAILILLICFTLVLAACSNSGDEANSTTGNKAESTDKTNTAGEVQQQPLKLTLMENTNIPPPKDTSIEQKLEAATNTIIDVNWVPVNEYQSRLNVSLGTGDIPDLVRLMPNGPQVYTSIEVEAIRNGVFHDLTEFIKAPDFAEKYPYLAGYPDEIWERVSVDNKIYAIPRQSEPVTFGGIWVRKDVVDSLGLKDPTTMDELADYIIALSSPPERYGLDVDGPNRIVASTFSPLSAAFTGTGSWGVDSGGNFEFQEFMPEYKDYLVWLKRLYDNGAIHPEFALGQASAKFREGTASIWAFRWHAFVKAERPILSFTDAAPDQAEAKLLMPVKGPKMWTVEANKGFFSKTAISKKVAKKDVPRILAMFNWMASPEGQAIAERGIEGIHHTVNNGKIELNQEAIKSEGLGAWSGAFAFGYRGGEWFINDLKNRGADEASLNQMAEVVRFTEEKYKEALANGYGQPHLNMYSPTLLKEWDQLTRDQSANRVKVIMGVMNLEEWDTYVNSIKDSAVYKSIQAELKDSYLKTR